MTVSQCYYLLMLNEMTRRKLKKEAQADMLLHRIYLLKLQKNYMKEIVKKRERQLRILTLAYISKKRPAAHYFILVKDRKHKM